MAEKQKQLVFLSCSPDGIHRALQERNGEWRTGTPYGQTAVTCLEADENDPRVVYAGTREDGVLVSRDAGASWQHLGLAGIKVRSLAVSLHDSQVIYAGTKPAFLYRSQDGGENWHELEGFRRIPGRWWWFTPAEPPFNQPIVQEICVSPQDPDLLLAGIEFGGLVGSTDGGETWSGHRKGAMRDCHSLTFHQTNGQYAYQGGAGRQVNCTFTRNAGETWTSDPDGIEKKTYGWAVAADPEDPEVVYVSSSPQPSLKGPYQPPAHIDGQAHASIFRKRGDEPWVQLSGGLPQPLDFMAYALVTLPGKPGQLYAGMSDGAVWYTSDCGDNWEKLPFELNKIHMRMTILEDSVSE
jgi:hypothetical protein